MTARYVYVVDDDDQVRRSLEFVLKTAGFSPRIYDSGQTFLDRRHELEPGCILLDVRMPGIDGMTLLEQLVTEHVSSPIIMMTGHGDIPMAVKAIKRGALEFLEKPFNDVQLIALLHKAFGTLIERSAEKGAKQDAMDKVAALSNRERDVLQGLVNGLNNKLLARKLDIGVRTIETYRSKLMDKLGASTIAEALQIAALAGIKPEVLSAVA